MTSRSTNDSQRGTFIILEGLDKTGKSTQTEMLLNYLLSHGKEARIQRFPDRSEPKTGHVIDTFLREAKSVQEDSEAMHLLFSANRWFLASKIREDLSNGCSVIVDRYSFSGIAYSLAKGLDKIWVCMPEVGLPKPDIVLFLDLDSAVTATRSGFGNEVLEQSDFQKSVYEHMTEIFNEAYWQIINASQSIINVHNSIVQKVDGALKAVANGKELESLILRDFGL